MKIAKTFRLEKEIAEQIKTLQKFYTKKLGFNYSQADVIQVLVKNEIASIDKAQLKSIE